jgi:hypothetical protein
MSPLTVSTIMSVLVILILVTFVTAITLYCVYRMFRDTFSQRVVRVMLWCTAVVYAFWGIFSIVQVILHPHL